MPILLTFWHSFLVILTLRSHFHIKQYIFVDIFFFLITFLIENVSAVIVGNFFSVVGPPLKKILEPTFKLLALHQSKESFHSDYFTSLSLLISLIILHVQLLQWYLS